MSPLSNLGFLSPGVSGLFWNGGTGSRTMMLYGFWEQSHCCSSWPELPSVYSHCALPTGTPPNSALQKSINKYCIVISISSLHTVIKTTFIICSLHCFLPGQNQTKSIKPKTSEEQSACTQVSVVWKSFSLFQRNADRHRYERFCFLTRD